MPSNALDANGLLAHAIRSDDPVMFSSTSTCIGKRTTKVRTRPEYMVPFGKANVSRRLRCFDHHLRRDGVPLGDAAKKVEELHGISAEVIDLRSLSLTIGSDPRTVQKTERF